MYKYFQQLMTQVFNVSQLYFKKKLNHKIYKQYSRQLFFCLFLICVFNLKSISFF